MVLQNNNNNNDVYGYIAAFISCLAFGSFAVPIKSNAANSVNIDPLVMQTYKTSMCLITSFFVLFYILFIEPQEEVEMSLLSSSQEENNNNTMITRITTTKFPFTYWGIMSGLFWVPGGTCGIYAIRKAGIAISQGIWSSLKVLVGFCWGIFIFNEHVSSKLNATFAIMMMMIGLCTMSYFAHPPSQQISSSSSSSSSSSLQQHQTETIIEGNDEDNYQVEPTTTSSLTEPLLSSMEEQQQQQQQNNAPNDDMNTTTTIEQRDVRNQDINNNNGDDDDVEDGGDENNNINTIQNNNQQQRQQHRFFTERQLGLLGAIVDGAYGGSILVPMHFAKKSHNGATNGLGYVFSFAVGASIILCCMWLLRILYYYFYYYNKYNNNNNNSSSSSSVSLLRYCIQKLPSFHFKIMWKAGCLAGLLWSIGNICSMLSVTYLGEGVGYSIVQGQLLIAGLWGIFYYNEIGAISTTTTTNYSNSNTSSSHSRRISTNGNRSRFGWFIGAILTVGGIIWLSDEHEI